MASVLEQILPESAERFRPRKPMSLLEWTEAAHIGIDGRPFNLDEAPHLAGIVEDEAEELVIRKGSQVQISSFSLTRVLHGADQKGQRWIYFLPTDDETDDFVADRVEKTINESEHLSSRIGKTDNRGLKHVGPGTVYFRGLWTKRRAKSVPADGLVFDEVDEHKPENVAFGEDRNLASRDPMKIFLSVPSFTRYGIDARFRESDQRFYRHQCPSCGKYNAIDEEWPNNLLPIATNRQKSAPDGATHYHGCRWCAAELDLRRGEWVVTQPDKRAHGYHVSRLYSLFYPPSFPNLATYLMYEWAKAQGDTEKLKRFVIAFRGFPFDGEGARINDDLLLSMEREGAGFHYSGHGTIMGVDQANALHVSIYAPIQGRRLQLIYCERAAAWSRVHDLFTRFGCYVGVSDRVPGLHEARGFAAKFKGRVIVQDFSGDDFEGEGDLRHRRIKEDLHDGCIAIPWVSVDRTSTLDATVDFVESGGLILPDRKRLKGDDLRHYEEYCINLTDLKWKFEDTPTGRRRVYLRNANHHGMGLNSARLGAFELGIKPPPPEVGVYGMLAPGMVGHA
jgi:hypothetical protein